MGLRTSVGIWAFGPNATRFVPSGYHPEAARETMVDRTRRAAAGLRGVVDGFEYHYPTEINEDTQAAIRRALGGIDVYCLALGVFSNPRYALGGFINPDRWRRAEVVRIAKAGVTLAGRLGAHFIIWPGAEGYNYTFQTDYALAWRWLIDGIAEVTEHAARRGVTVLLEHKNSEPAMRILMRDIGMTLYTIHKVAQAGVDTSRLLVNMDWQHLIMNGENLAEYATLLAGDGRLGHQHSNSGWGTFDDDNMTGASFFMQALEMALTLRDVGYGRHGERMGFDLFPYTEDQVDAVRQSVLQWKFIESLADRVDVAALREARTRKDAVAGYREVYRALGLDEASLLGGGRRGASRPTRARAAAARRRPVRSGGRPRR
jgi:xylose isomerase